jgi:hypothetical protein
MLYIIKEFLEKKGFKYEISKSTFSKSVIHIFYLDDNKWKCYLSINRLSTFTNIRLEFFKSDEDYVTNDKYYYEIICDYYEIICDYKNDDYILLSEEYYHIVDIFIKKLDFLLNRELIHYFRKIKIKKLLNYEI